jgi:tRNA(fMet)-specific endonuclease VapC
VTYLLDTNACVVYLNGRAPRLRERLRRTTPSEMVVCSVVKAELFYGSRKSKNPAENLQRQQSFLAQYESVPFDDAAAVAYAGLRLHLEVGGTPIGGNDMMIAAIAIANSLILVTHNSREFLRVPRLRVEDWEMD